MNRDPIRVLWLPVAGEPQVLTRRPTLENFRRFVDGDLEAVTFPGMELGLFINETGRLIGKPWNPSVAYLFGDIDARCKDIRGDAVLVRGDEEGNEVSLTGQDIESIKNRAAEVGIAIFGDEESKR